MSETHETVKYEDDIWAILIILNENRFTSIAWK